MPKIDSTPDAFRPFLFHGLDLTTKPGAKDGHGDCPFCGAAGKFSVEVETSLWQCWRCQRGGNDRTFLREVWDGGVGRVDATADKALAASRGLLGVLPLAAWGVVRSPVTGEVIVPSWHADGTLANLYRWARSSLDAKKRVLLPTAGIGHGGLFSPGPPGEAVGGRAEIWLCESLWDAMAVWEVLRRARRDESGAWHAVAPGNANAADHIAVLASPGANIWSDSWAPLFEGKRVAVLYHNDHERPDPKAPGKALPGAGWLGMRRVAGALLAGEVKAATVCYLKWGEGDRTCNPNLPSGHDLRDGLTAAGPTVSARLTFLQELASLVVPAPESWVNEARQRARPTITPKPCRDWATLEAAWVRAVEWTPGMRKALVSMLGTVLSTGMLGGDDQVWLRVISPPSTGKSVLCEAISVARRFVVPRSSIRGLHSGYKSDKEGTVDHSLIAMIRGKTLVTKDGDTLLAGSNKEQTLSELRDLYDGASRSHYRHGMDRVYENWRTTYVLAGTEALRQLDDSELGARMLDCRIMRRVDDDAERRIGLAKLDRVFANKATAVDGRIESLAEPRMLEAKRLTGGYVEHLRDNAARLLEPVRCSPDRRSTIERFGAFVARMRARPSKRQQESQGREMSTRLVSQLGMLGACVTAVLGRRELDDEVLSIVREVALDTADGETLDVLRAIRALGQTGTPVSPLSVRAGIGEERLRGLLHFMRKDLGIVEVVRVGQAGGFGTRQRWRLTASMEAMAAEILDFEAGQRETPPGRPGGAR